MNYPGAEPENSKESSWRKIPLWLRLVLFFLLFLVLISFGIIINLLGRTTDYKGYTGQIIDTIILSPRPSPVSEYDLPFNLHGSFQYLEAKQYRVELLDASGKALYYTLSDADDIFEFTKLQPGTYTLNLFSGDELIASCTLKVQREALITAPQLVRTEENAYILLIPMDLPTVFLYFSMDGMAGDNTSAGNQLIIRLGPDPSDPSRPTPTAQASTVTSTPVPPVIINPAPTPFNPRVIVRDNTTTGQIWTSYTAVDLFAERPGNFGVQTLQGKNVIAPGSYGAYSFTVRNPESLPMEYKLRLTETDGNTPNLPMLYRLKRGTAGSDYIGGSAWQTAQSIALDWTAIAPNATNAYTLEWQWDPSNNTLDTAIGTQTGSPSYVLVITITAQEH